MTVPDAPTPPRVGTAAFLRDLSTGPNILSFGRLFGLGAALWAFFTGHYWVSLSVGLASGLTDYLDGWMARKYKIVTQLGALLDQTIDLLYAFVCLSLLVEIGGLPRYVLFLWGFRDITILAVRLSAAQQGFTIPSVLLGKAASNFLFYGFLFSFAFLATSRGIDLGWLTPVVEVLGKMGLYGGVTLQWISGIIYIRSYIRQYRSTP